MRIKDSVLSCGYHAKHKGTATCSMRSLCKTTKWSLLLVFRSYSTWREDKETQQLPCGLPAPRALQINWI